MSNYILHTRTPDGTLVDVPVERARDLNTQARCAIYAGRIVLGYTVTQTWEGKPWTFKCGTRHFGNG